MVLQPFSGLQVQTSCFEGPSINAGEHQNLMGGGERDGTGDATAGQQILLNRVSTGCSRELRATERQQALA